MLKKLKSIHHFLSPRFQTAHYEYKVDLKPRYGHGLPAHRGLEQVINKERKAYSAALHGFLQHADTFTSFSSGRRNEQDPHWNNGFLPGLDIIALYGIIAAERPVKYVEVGSGNSTKVVHRAIKDNGLSTTITSIDPMPRASIDDLAGTVVRKPFEDLDVRRHIIDVLEEGDILFIDNSHRVFPNSDAMVFFLEVLPFLKKGVLVHVHDIYLPYDYPQFMCDRYYNEQYMLAAFILADPERYKVVLPNFFISEDPELRKILDPIWQHPALKGVEQHGGSFWFRIDRDPRLR